MDMNKPVAWLHIQGDYSEAHARPLDKDEIARGWEEKPLYTHPVEELTDEEIMEYVEAFSIDMGDVYEFQPENVLEMIKQILHKAQENG